MATLLDKYYNVRIKLRNDSHINWAEKENTFVPFDGEIIIYDILDAEEAIKLSEKRETKIDPIPFQMIKIGDGKTTLGMLPFVNDFASYIGTGEKNGAISVLGKDVFVQGLQPSQYDTYMAFELQEDYYTKTDVDKKIKEEADARIAADEQLQKNIDAEKSAREAADIQLQGNIDAEITARIKAVADEAAARIAADNALDAKIEETRKNIEENIEVKLNEVRDDFYEFKEETEAAIEESNKKNAITLENPSSLVYNLLQGGNLVGTINIPKDLFVKSGKIVIDPDGLAAGTYIELVLQNQEEPIYINVGSLIDIYTHQQQAAQVQVNVDNNTRIISASIVPGSITSTEIAAGSITQDRLSSSVQSILETAKSQLSDGEGSVSERFEELRKYVDEQIATLYIDDMLFNCIGVDEGE